MSREAHVNRDRVPVVHRVRLRRQLVHRRPGVPVRDRPVLVVLVEVRRLELQHPQHRLPRDRPPHRPQPGRRVLRIPKLVLDQILAVLLKQLEALNQMKKLIQTGAVPLCEKFLKPLVCRVFLDQAVTHRMVKIQAYKLINLLSRHYNIVEILRMEDEPRMMAGKRKRL